MRTQNHDVLYAAESAQATPDQLLLAQANEEERIVITADRDFGELVFHQRLNSFGIVLLRLRANRQIERLQTFISLWDEIQKRATGHFIVAVETRLRVRRLYGSKE